jgi:hypothetical protein
VYKAGFAALTAPVYKADFAALTAPGVMAGAVGGPVARALHPRLPIPPMGGGGVENAISQIPLRSIQVRQEVASRSPQDCVYNSYEEPELSDKDSGGSRGSSAGLHMISYQRTLRGRLVWARMVVFRDTGPDGRPAVFTRGGTYARHLLPKRSKHFVNKMSAFGWAME